MRVTAADEARVIEERHTSGIYQKRPLTIVRGDGASVWDDEGREYLDCVGGQGTANIGHAHPAVTAALSEQAARIIALTELFYSDQRAAFYAALASILPAYLDRFFLCNSGAEAVEAALKFARASTKKERIVAAMRGFHGKTFGALSATWSPEYRDAFGPLVPGFVHARFNDVADLDAKIDDRTAAVILECVQGEGGVRPADADYLRHAERLCRERGALLVIDEVQTGFGRTGKYLAIEHFGIAPDVVCLAKSVAGGVPMGVVAFSRSLGDLPKRSHTSTFGGNPLACAAGVAAIGVLLGERLVQNAAARGTELIAGLRSVRSEKVREVRGLGLMVGVEVREPAGPTLRRMADEGVLALAAGPTVVRFLPPLCITAEQVDRAVRAFAEAVAP